MAYYGQDQRVTAMVQQNQEQYHQQKQQQFYGRPQDLPQTLAKNSQVLSNGAVGIDFKTLGAPNLARSEVLKMLEEDERHLNSGMKRVAWPPEPDADGMYPNVQNQNLYDGEMPPPQTNVWPNNPNPQGQYPQPQQTQIVYQKPQQQQPPPPQTIQLRSEAPVTQEPQQVYAAQPVVKTQVPFRCRGDLKWPPESWKQKQAFENAEKPDTVIPRKETKDYRPFFERHTLTPTYPPYRAPPGTQHYWEYIQSLQNQC